MTDPIMQLLAEAGMSDDSALLDELIHLRESSIAVRPIPSRELALLLGRRRRSSLGHRGVITALIVVGAVSGAATAAAASPDVRAAVNRAVQTVVGAIVPAPAATTTDNSVGRHPTPSNAPSPHGSAPSHSGASDHPNPTNHPGGGAGNDPSHSDNGSTRDPNPGNGNGNSTPAPTDPGNSGKH
jgi:hypothetical protein